MTPDRPLPFRRDPSKECPSCWAFPGEKCGPYCLSWLSDAEQIAHRDAVIDGVFRELDMLEDDQPVGVLDCRLLTPGRHRKPDPRWRRIPLSIVVLVLVLVWAAIWLAADANADEWFDVCPSGSTGVATADTSCAFADNVRAAFYAQPGWTVFAYSPVTGNIYTMQCGRATTELGWPSPKRCFGISPGGDPLVVYIR
jgi:hypothetical protein